MKQLMAEEKKPIGMFVNTACPEMVEITAKTGFDFVFIDNEHGSWGIETNAHLVRAAESFDCIPLIRVPNIDEARSRYRRSRHRRPRHQQRGGCPQHHEVGKVRPCRPPRSLPLC